MLEGRARVEDTDMPARMQDAATSAASRALDLFDVADCRAIAGHIKTARSLSSLLLSSLCSAAVLEFDKRYGVGWQCVVGANFGCFFTHSSGTFIYFSMERLSFLLFKAAVVAAAAAAVAS
ncbi:Dynein light chain LC6, flagellar outer arm [Zea mays]|uniref:Dynein light chain n=1 Tax=Zea mays TaxID=4577 RepID=A0A3L6EFE2_MAIZE|nr:Dynein light chain LC6, flagellar outer arm [Zea mays]